MRRHSTLQTPILAGERHLEITRLPVVCIAHMTSDKLNLQPLPEKSRPNHRSLAPGGDLHQWERFPQPQSKQMRQRVCCRGNLHPQLQRVLRLLPQVRHAPPTFQIVEQRFDPPTFGINLENRLCRQIRFARQNQAWTRPGGIPTHRPYEPQLFFRARAESGFCA